MLLPQNLPASPQLKWKRMRSTSERSISYPHKEDAKLDHASETAIEVERVPAWSEYSWLVHGFSTRLGGETTAYRPDQPAGELNLGFTASDAKETVLANRRLFV